MGSLTAKFSAKRSVSILTVGLSGSGKSTMLYKLKLGEIVNSMSNFGYKVETIDFKDLSFTMWVLGEATVVRDNLTHVLEQFLPNKEGLIACIDTNNIAELPRAAEMLKRLLARPELNELPLLIFASKRDLPGAYDMAEFNAQIGIDYIQNRPVHVQESSFITGQGLEEGIEWLRQSLPPAQPSPAT